MTHELHDIERTCRHDDKFINVGTVLFTEQKHSFCGKTYVGIVSELSKNTNYTFVTVLWNDTDKDTIIDVFTSKLRTYLIEGIQKQIAQEFDDEIMRMFNSIKR